MTKPTPLAQWIDNHVADLANTPAGQLMSPLELIQHALTDMNTELQAAAQRIRGEEASASIRADLPEDRAVTSSECAHGVFTDSNSPVNVWDSSRATDSQSGERADSE